jgi:tight adherence protein B
VEWIIAITVFIFTVLLTVGFFYFLRTSWDPEFKRIKTQLRAISPRAMGDEDLDLTRKRLLSSMPWFHRLLITIRTHIPVIEKLDRLVMQANVQKPLGLFLLIAAVLGIATLVAVGQIAGYVVALPVSLILVMTPFFYLQLKKNKRMRKFESQLPEALDLVARALKAGHSFSSGLFMVAQEFEDPIGPEFAKTLDEINFGIGVPEALKGLMNRIDCPDLRFFVVSVILQRETGGNLAEILENIGRLIRDRFKLMDRVKTLSAEGKLSAIILISLPFLVAIFMTFISPDNIKFLIFDGTGRFLTLWIIINMIFGVLVMRKIIRIKV